MELKGRIVVVVLLDMTYMCVYLTINMMPRATYITSSTMRTELCCRSVKAERENYGGGECRAGHTYALCWVPKHNSRQFCGTEQPPSTRFNSKYTYIMSESV